MGVLRGNGFYYFNLTVYLIYLASLTIFALNQKPPYNAANPDDKTKLKNVLDCSDSDKDRESNGEINCVTLRYHKQWLIQIFGFIVLGTSAIRLILELAQFIVQKIKYFSIMNVIEVILFVSSIYFCHTVIFGLRIIESEAQWQIGVFSVFIAWMNLIMFLRKVRMIMSFLI